MQWKIKCMICQCKRSREWIELKVKIYRASSGVTGFELKQKASNANFEDKSKHRWIWEQRCVPYTGHALNYMFITLARPSSDSIPQQVACSSSLLMLHRCRRWSDWHGSNLMDVRQAASPPVACRCRASRWLLACEGALLMVCRAASECAGWPG
jgi:hypothetical protein